MKKSIGTKLNMYRAVLEVCKSHEQNWATIPGFVTTVNDFENTLIDLEHQAQLQTSRTVGVSTVKAEKVTLLYDRLLLLQGALEVYGTMIGDSELRLRNKIVKTDLNRKTISALNVHVNSVLVDLNTHGAALEQFGITPIILAESISIMQSTQHALNRPRMAIIDRKLNTNSLDLLMHEIDSILKVRLDKLMRLFKGDVPTFFALYFNARMIIDSHPKKSNPQIPPTSSPSIEPDDGFH